MVADAVQPFTFVALMLYIPCIEVVIEVRIGVDAVEENPLGPCHEKLSPPLALRLMVMPTPMHTGLLLLTLMDGLPCTITVAVAD